MFINPDKRLHQDNLKSEIYYRFNNKFVETDFKIILEYTSGRCRFDALVYDNPTNKVVAIIEVRSVNARRPPHFGTKKHLKYIQFGCNIFYISRFSAIDELLESCGSLFNEWKTTGEIKFTTTVSDPKPRKVKRQIIY